MHIRRAIKIATFPIYSFFSRRIGFSIFFPLPTGWHLYTRGKVIPVKSPSIDSLEYFRHFLPTKGSVVFDIGGELGIETEQFLAIVGKKGRVYTFECFPEHIVRLKELAHKHQNLTVVEKACWNEPSSLKFYQGHTAGSNTLLHDVRGQRNQLLANNNKSPFLIEADTLDNLWEQLTQGCTVDFLKMDIEGAEYEALEGASKLLSKTNKVVVAAYHIRDGKKTASKVAKMLISAGFQVRIDENNHVYGTRKH